MGIAVLNITMSLDGFVAGPNISTRLPLGENGERLHNWLFSEKTPVDEQLANDIFAQSGAVVAGRRTYDLAINDAWGGKNPFRGLPVYVVTHRAAEGQDGFHFVTEGLAAAIQKARETAGDKIAWIMGGGAIARQCIQQKLVDEIRLHIAPVIQGGGVHLFGEEAAAPIELQSYRVEHSPGATHIFYKVL